MTTAVLWQQGGVGSDATDARNVEDLFRDDLGQADCEQEIGLEGAELRRGLGFVDAAETEGRDPSCRRHIGEVDIVRVPAGTLAGGREDTDHVASVAHDLF